MNTDDEFKIDAALLPASTDVGGQPVYLASAGDFHDGIHPCKIASHLGGDVCRVSWDRKKGSYTLREVN